jgi:hypothetical protein
MKIMGIVLVMGFLTGCSSVSVQDYKSETPVLKLENYLSGKLDAYGIFQDRSGKIVKRFQVAMVGTWKDGVGTLDEDFTYSDGSKSRRIWTIKKTGENNYSGTAADVIGVALGESAGNAFQWKYTLDLPVDASNYHVQFDDWMFLMDEKIMINKSKMSKFGIYLGEVTLTFVKH